MDKPMKIVLEQSFCDIIQDLCLHPELAYCISCPEFQRVFGK
jgi:hypothetical protein